MHYTANMRSFSHCTKRLGSLYLACIGFAQIVVGFQRIGLGVEPASLHLKFKPFSIRSLERLMNFFFICLLFPANSRATWNVSKSSAAVRAELFLSCWCCVVIFHFNFTSLSSNHLRPCNKTEGPCSAFWKKKEL